MNHDLPRVASRFDDAAGHGHGHGHGAARARAAALILYALRGTPFVYQGQELGLPNAEIPPDRVVDVDGRDRVRAPIPWEPPSEAGPGAGFTTGRPWLPLPAEAEEACVARQGSDGRSMLTLVRRLAAARARLGALQTGAQRSLEAGSGVLAWLREDADDRVLAAVNFTRAPVALQVDAGLPAQAELLLSTDPDRRTGAVEPGALVLGPAEGVLLRW